MLPTYGDSGSPYVQSFFCTDVCWLHTGGLVRLRGLWADTSLLRSNTVNVSRLHFPRL